jgi:H+/Cl- antiporter ClcA/predicted transcriptional regulator
MALIIGALSAVVAYVLLRLIGIVTNLAFYGRWSSSLSSPAGNHLGGWVVLVPVVGALVIGVMARFGSEKIRGHGIPEAMEAILIGGSKIEPKVAVLKPLSSAISIGTGGPFGAEGPIIMTGGALGSLFAQLFHLTDGERKALLVAGAAGGMSATFGTPVAAVLIAVELLLFEWKPRSLIPVAIASATAAALRPTLLGGGALFPVTVHTSLPWTGLLVCVGVGLIAGLGSGLLTGLVYGFEDLFQKLPIHWMWWPAIGGLCIGIGGLIEPRALGVGYDDIHRLLNGRLVGTAVLGLVIVKALIWSFSLGSGTSGGVLAPLLIMGGALGALEGHWISIANPGFWAMISMAAMVGGTMRSPLTAIVFTLELTHAVNALLPLLIACTVAFAVTVLLMRRSILTEKVARRGHHLTREFGVDPFETRRVADVMTPLTAALSVHAPLEEALEVLAPVQDDATRVHQGFPVVDEHGAVVGVITRGDLAELAMQGLAPGTRVGDVVVDPPIIGDPDEPVGHLADRMALADVDCAAIVTRADELVGIVTRTDLLKVRSLRQKEDVERQQILRPRLPRRRG